MHHTHFFFFSIHPNNNTQNTTTQKKATHLLNIWSEFFFYIFLSDFWQKCGKNPHHQKE